jgi:hypothetical protein
MAPRFWFSRAARRGAASVVAICATVGAAGCASASRDGSAGASGSGFSTSSHSITTESPAAFRKAVVEHLRSRHLDYRWVVCVRTPHRFAGVPIVRCNVDFGEPHIMAYCSVLRDGRLLTSEEDPAIPCGHDNAGYSDPVVTYG